MKKIKSRALAIVALLVLMVFTLSGCYSNESTRQSEPDAKTESSIPPAINDDNSNDSPNPQRDIHPYIDGSWGEDHTSDKASKFIGQFTTIFGKVYGVNYANESNGKPTFVDIGGDYPNQDLTLVIWEESRSNFEPVGSPESYFESLIGKWLWIDGTPYTYNGTIQIEIQQPLMAISLDDVANASDN